MIGPDDQTVGDKNNMKKELSNEDVKDQTVLKEISKDNRCTVQDHMKTSIGVQAFEILQIIKDEDFNVQDNLEKNIVAKIDQEENRCTVQDHMEILNDDEAFEILQSVKDEDLAVHDNLDKDIDVESKGGLTSEDAFTLVPFSKKICKLTVPQLLNFC